MVDSQKKFGGAGYRSRYLSHAKRALYHLSYAPRYGQTTQIQCLAFQFQGHKEHSQQLSWYKEYQTLDSSVGRAVDCSCICQTSIGRWFKSGSRDFLPQGGVRESRHGWKGDCCWWTATLKCPPMSVTVWMWLFHGAGWLIV